MNLGSRDREMRLPRDIIYVRVLYRILLVAQGLSESHRHAGYLRIVNWRLHGEDACQGGKAKLVSSKLA